MNKKMAIITGITGQDGSYLAEYLLSLGYYIVGGVRRSSIQTFNRLKYLKCLNHPELKLEILELNDPSSINKLIQKYQPDEYYNLAAMSQVRDSFDIPSETLNCNINGCLFALEAIKNYSPKTKFYQAGSSEMFGDQEPRYPAGFYEDEEFKPASPYAISKTTCHYLIQNYRKAYKLLAWNGILFNHTSFLRGETFVCKKIAHAAVSIKNGLQDKIELGNINSFRDWGYAPEYIQYMNKMLTNTEPDDFILATGEAFSIRQWLEECFSYIGLDPYKYLVYNKELERPQEVNFLLGDANKAKKKLNFKPKYHFKDIIKTIMDEEIRIGNKNE